MPEIDDAQFNALVQMLLDLYRRQLATVYALRNLGIHGEATARLNRLRPFLRFRPCLFKQTFALCREIYEESQSFVKARIQPWRSPYLRWRMETYWGLHADSISFREFRVILRRHRTDMLRYAHWATRQS